MILPRVTLIGPEKENKRETKIPAGVAVETEDLNRPSTSGTQKRARKAQPKQQKWVFIYLRSDMLAITFAS